jgi:hypothetical protein
MVAGLMQILTKNSVFLPTTTAKGLAMSGTFQNGTSFYVGSLLTFTQQLPHPASSVCIDGTIVEAQMLMVCLAALQYTRNHTLLGTAADPDDGTATFRPNDGAIIP